MQVLAHREPATVENSRGELTALTAGCGVYRPERALLSLSGRDRVRWLNGMVSNNVRDLSPGRGIYAFVLTSQGHIQADLYAFNRGESIVVETERSQAETVLAIFRKYIIMDKVEIEDLRENTAVIGLAGRNSEKVLSSLGLTPHLDSLQAMAGDLSGTEITLLRGDNPQFPNYELWMAADRAQSVWDALLTAGAEEVNDDMLEAFRIICGIPKVGQDIRERTLPQETGQDRALNFTKGCYIGQEIVERIRARGAVHKTFTGFELEGPLPLAGVKIQSDGKDVGEITSVLAAPSVGKQLALGYLRKEFAGGDKELKAGEAIVKPVALPLRIDSSTPTSNSC
jgi:folate-binding protein YgfZ